MSKKKSSSKKSKSSGGLDPELSEVKPEYQKEEGADSAESKAEKDDAGSADQQSKSAASGAGKKSSAPVMVTSMWPGKLIVYGKPSGNRYVWEDAGATVAVDPDDLPFLAEKNRKIRACCGSSGERRYFDLS